MAYYGNLVRLESIFKKYYKVIASAFDGEISTLSELELPRNYEYNGAAHFAVRNHAFEFDYVRLSTCYYINPNKTYISFNVKDLKSGKFDSLSYWFFINRKYKSAIKVDWQGLLGKLNIAETTSDYLEIELVKISCYVTKYSLNDSSSYYPCKKYRHQKRIFPYKIFGSNKIKVILNRADGKTCEFVSLKHFYFILNKYFKVKLNLSSYGSLKTRLSKEQPIKSKCGRYRMTSEKKDGVWVFTAYQKTFGASVKIKTVCTHCIDKEKAEIKEDEELQKRYAEEDLLNEKIFRINGLEWLTSIDDDFLDVDRGLAINNSSKYSPLPSLENQNIIKCPYHFDADGKPLMF